MKKNVVVSITLILISALVMKTNYAFAQFVSVAKAELRRKLGVDMNYQRFVQEIENKWIESEKKRIEEFKVQQEAKYQAFKRQDEEAYRQYVKEVEEKWNKFIGPTRRQWVDYSEDKSTRTIVNFEKKEKAEDNKGQISIETILPADQRDLLAQAKKRIVEQAKKIFSPAKKNRSNHEGDPSTTLKMTLLLEGQVKTQDGKSVKPENVEKFVKEEVLPEAKINPKPIKSKDGIERVKVTVVIPMVPDHLKIRVTKYMQPIKKYSKQHKMDVPLVLAVIETESYFNPKAKSHIPAFGLMQLVPKYGGRDAYKYVFKKDKMPTPSYLYVPENNVLLGTAYLCVLKENYLYGIKDRQKQEYLMIAAYNGGIGRVIKLLKKHNVRQISSSEVYDALRREMPKETKDYLAKVTSRKKKYAETDWRK